jgi:hypothetical protein
MRAVLPPSRRAIPLERPEHVADGERGPGVGVRDALDLAVFGLTVEVDLVEASATSAAAVRLLSIPRSSAAARIRRGDVVGRVSLP